MFFAIDGQADAGWQAVPLGSISIAETSVYVFAACLPSYRTFFTQSKGRFGTTTGGSAHGKPSFYSSTKSTELKSLDRATKGFSRLTHDEKDIGVNSKYSGDASEEELVVSPDTRSIQVHTSFVVKNERK